MLFPNIPFRTIDKINSAIDNPDRKAIAMQNSGLFSRKELDTFGLTRQGHRKFNHTVDSAIMAAFMVDPKNAFELAMTHLLVDKMGNYVHDRMGSNGKDMYEAQLNQMIDSYRQTNMGYAPRKRKQMFF